jgi:hypothetical protein
MVGNFFVDINDKILEIKEAFLTLFGRIAHDLDLKPFQDFAIMMRTCDFGVPFHKGEIEAGWDTFHGFLLETRKRRSVSSKEFDSVVSLCQELVSYLLENKLFLMKKEFKYNGFRCFLVETQFPFVAQIGPLPPGNVATILLSNRIPLQFRDPVLEHEAAEWNYMQEKYVLRDVAHKLAGVPEGRRKAEEMGILEAYLAYEEEVSI